MRQSMPSSSIDSCAGVSDTAPLVACGQTKRPRSLVCVGERYNRYGKRLLLQVDDSTVCSVPPQWTDLVACDPEIAMGERRALLRVADFMDLARLVARLGRGARQWDLAR